MLRSPESLTTSWIELYEAEHEATTRRDASLIEAAGHAGSSDDLRIALKGIRHVLRQNERLRSSLRAALRHGEPT